MSEPITVSCWGGPADGQLIAVRDRSPLRVPVPPKLSTWTDEPADSSEIMMDDLKVISYDIKRIAVGPQVWDVAIAPGYPVHRIIDGAMAILGLCRLAEGWRFPYGLGRSIASLPIFTPPGPAPTADPQVPDEVCAVCLGTGIDYIGRLCTRHGRNKR